MGLKQDIIVVNRFTKRTASGGPGEHGSTPGEYVMRYMARADAVERMPVMGYRNPSVYIERYMTRADAVEHSPDMDIALNERHRRHPRHDELSYTGTGFGSWVDASDKAHGPIRRYAASLSADQLLEASRQIQALYDGGNGEYRAVYETVVSFSGDYLERNGVLDSSEGWPRRPDGTIDDDAVERGAYRGRIDQGKLRTAIMHGLERINLARGGLTYVGVIQVDTSHVHCHLAMATEHDVRGGARRDGRVSLRQIDLMRRGIDAALDRSRSVAFMAASEQRERRNLVSAVGEWAARLGASSRAVQQLVSLLPSDARRWRAASRARIMKRPNALARAMVEQALMSMPAELADWERSVDRYVAARSARGSVRGDDDLPVPSPEGGRGGPDAASLRRGAWTRMMERCINELYRHIREMQRRERITPLMDYMRMDRGRIAEELSEPGRDERRARMASFALRARNYSERIAEHNRLEAEYLRRAYRFERGIIAMDGRVDRTMRDVAAYYRDEADYQARCTDKYRHYIAAEGHPERWEREWDRRVRPARARADRAAAMLVDPAFDEEPLAGDPSRAREYAWRTYGVDHGEDMVTTAGRRRTARVLVPTLRLEADYAAADLRARARGDGIVMDDGGRAHRGVEHGFWGVRGIDLHDMVEDSIRDEPLGMQAARQFEQAVRMRLAGMRAIQRYADSITSRTGITGRGAIGHEPVAMNIHEMLDVFRDLQGQMEQEQEERPNALVLRSRLARTQAAGEQRTQMDDMVTGPDEAVRPDVRTIVGDSVRREIDLMDGGAPAADQERGGADAPD